jgi:hypothetical protein
MLLVWRRNLSSVSWVSNKIPETKFLANAVSAHNFSFAGVMYQTIPFHEGLAPLRTMCVERTTLA